MLEPFDKIRHFKYQKITDGFAIDIKDLYEKIIKHQFNNTSAIKQIHNSIIEYVEGESPTFFIRLYGSFRRENYDFQRRGFLTEYANKIRCVFCDNTFTLMFSGMKLAGIPFSQKELQKILNQKKLVVGFAQVTEEKELAFYSPSGAIRFDLNSLGWYQAHIYPVGYGFKNKSLKDYFPNPRREEYDSILKKRIINDVLTHDELEVLKAHFIRLIHPFNSFLIPKVKHVSYDGKNIGEEEELILFVKDKVNEMFPSEFREFERLAKLGYEIKKPTKIIKSIKWCSKPKYLKIKKVKPQEFKTENKEIDNQFNIGSYVRFTFEKLNNSKKLSEEQIENLQSLVYCKKVFKISYPVLITNDKSIKDANGYNRYYSKEIFKNYWLCSQWTKNHWENFLSWESMI